MRRTATLSVTITLVTALVLLQPSQIWSQEPTSMSSQGNAATGQESTASVFQPILQCKLATQPANAIDMNTVSLKSMVKTVHVEKEFFNCVTATPISMPIIVMVSIYTELLENVSSSTLIKTNTVETCEKLLNGTFLGCIMKVPPAILRPITSCTTQPLFAPVRMNTVVATGPSASPNVAETIEAEKEVFSCNPATTGLPTTIEDVTIFTKILEDINTGKTLGTKFVVSTCTKNIVNAFVACK